MECMTKEEEKTEKKMEEHCETRAHIHAYATTKQRPKQKTNDVRTEKQGRNKMSVKSGER